MQLKAYNMVYYKVLAVKIQAGRNDEGNIGLKKAKILGAWKGHMRVEVGLGMWRVA